MASDPTNASADSAGIFEVFRVGSVPYDALISQDFESIKQKYLLVVPISSKDELKKDSCLAVIPPPSHMIVDQTKFRQLVAKQAVDLSAKRTTEIIKRSETTIENIKAACVAEVDRIYQSMHQIVEKQKSELQDAILKLSSSEESSSERRQEILQNAFQAYEKRIENLLAEMTASQNQLKEKDFGGSLDESDNAVESQDTN
eukprot:TRINITY_DN8691_c0_g1_i1.p1 TRINITY_DN8691_c0_g1~~TRINITY_DN8691_c0_g1_i1.p1  ORF type:complete len:208 (-),score=49.87 TRINITY_DN8691_c0_g1_i1:155-757(-)